MKLFRMLFAWASAWLGVTAAICPADDIFVEMTKENMVSECVGMVNECVVVHGRRSDVPGNKQQQQRF